MLYIYILLRRHHDVRVTRELRVTRNVIISRANDISDCFGLDQLTLCKKSYTLIAIHFLNLQTQLHI